MNWFVRYFFISLCRYVVLSLVIELFRHVFMRSVLALFIIFLWFARSSFGSFHS